MARQRGLWVLFAILALALSGCASRPVASPTTTSTTHAEGDAGGPSTFVATMPQAGMASPSLVLASASDGSVLNVLHSLPWDLMNVSGTALGPDNTIWVTLNRGPTYTSNVAGGAPAPHSCASEVVTVDPHDRTTAVVLQGSDDELISDATPSPNGKLLAYLQSGCATEYFDSWLTVKDLSNGESWEIGAGLPRCHVLASPVWSSDSEHLVVTYGQASTPSYTGPEGTCSTPDPSVMTVIPVTSGASDLPSVRVNGAPDPGCEISAAVPTTTGYTAIEHCGGNLFISGPMQLLRYSGSGQKLSNIYLGKCEDGADLATDRGGRDVIVSAYLFCNPPGTQPPLTKVWVFAYDSGAPRQILSLEGGTLLVTNVSW